MTSPQVVSKWSRAEFKESSVAQKNFIHLRRERGQAPLTAADSKAQWVASTFHPAQAIAVTRR